MGIVDRYVAFKKQWEQNVPDEEKRKPFNLLKHMYLVSRLQRTMNCSKAEYFYYRFYELSEPEQQEYIMDNGYESHYVKLWNEQEDILFTTNKPDFNQVFPEYVRRDWIEVRKVDYDRFRQFAEDYPICIEKPVGGHSGQGVCIRHFPPLDALPTLFDELNRKNVLLEERLNQNSILASLNPDSINTIRIVTLRRDNVPDIIMAGLRIGRKGKVADNFGAGGICAKLDFSTGRIVRPAISKHNVLYTKHPDSGIDLIGFQVPMWEELRSTAIVCAEKMPGNLVGWDFAINEKDEIVIVEANSAPDIMLMQMVEGHGYRTILSK